MTEDEPSLHALVAGNAAVWGHEDDRVLAVIVYGSIARGTSRATSDVDLLVVAREGRREDLWADRQHVAATILGDTVATATEPTWQRSYRYQAWRADLAVMLDLTVDEGQAYIWRGIVDGYRVLVDKADMTGTLAASIEAWRSPPLDAVALTARFWPWVDHLIGMVEKGQCWATRSGLHELIDACVLPLLEAEPDQFERVADPTMIRALEAAAPSSADPAELARSVRAVVALFDAASATSTHGVPDHPLERRVRERLA